MTIIFFFNLLLAADKYPQIAGEPNWIVCGRLIDEKGRPVSDGGVYPGGDKISGTSDVVAGVSTDKTGNFCLSLKYGKTPKPFRLFSEGKHPDRAMRIISPPYDGLPNELRLSFAGPRVVFGNKKKLNIGNVRLKTLYKVVKITVAKPDGQPAFKIHSEWVKVWIRLLDSRGNLIVATGLSDHHIADYVDLDKSQISLALPKGDWIIQVSNDVRLGTDTKYGYTGTFYGGAVTTSKDSNDSIELTIRIPPSTK